MKLIEVFGNAKNHLVSRRAEFAAEIKPYLPKLLDSLEITMDDVVQALPLVYGVDRNDLSSSSSQDIEEVASIREFSEMNLEAPSLQIQEPFNSVNFPDIPAEKLTIIEAFLSSFFNHFGTPFKELIPELLRRSIPLVESHASAIVQVLDSYDTTTCAICGIFDCRDHHVEYRLDHDKIESRNKGRQSYDHGDSSGDESIIEIESGPCSKDCFLKVADRIRPNPDDWEAEDIALLRTLVSAMPRETNPACIICQVFGKTCKDVHVMILSLSPPRPNRVKGQALGGKKLVWYNNETKKIIVNNWGQYTKTHSHHEREMPKPCSHRGSTCEEAGDKCSCINQNVLCEKHCTCLDDCE